MSVLLPLQLPADPKAQLPHTSMSLHITDAYAICITSHVSYMAMCLPQK
jgi:hypothetical protein